MGKTLVGILEIGAAIAAQFIPGLNVVAGVSLGITLGATGLATLLSKTPKPSITSQALKSPLPPRISGYCHMRARRRYIR